MRFDNGWKITLQAGLLALLSLAMLSAGAAPQAAKKNKSAIESKAFHYFVDQAAGWVRPVEVPAQPSNVEGNPVLRILLHDEQRQFADKGISTYTHYAMQPLQKSALDKVARIEIEFSPEYQTLTLHDFVVIRDGERINKLDRSKVQLIQREKELEKQMYVGVVSASVLLDDVRLGDVVEYAYTVHGSNPIFANKIDFAFELSGWNVPVERLHVRLLTPVGRNFAYKLHNIDLQPQVSEQNGVRETVWNRMQIPAVLEEGEHPRWFIPVAWVEGGEYENWAQVSAWAEPMYRIPNVLAPQLQAQIERWRSSSASVEEAALRALNFVQQEIRYFGVEIGVSSHRPAHPDQVFKQRYGDCKDKSLLLATIFNRLGIKAHPALVSSRFYRAVAEGRPTPRAFDHVITRVEINGKVWWVDATNNFQAGGFEQRGYEDFGRALVIGDGSSDLSAVTVPDNGDRNIEEVYAIDEFDQPVTLTVVERLNGSAANFMRYLMGSYGTERMNDHRYNMYARMFQGIQRSGPPRLYDDVAKNEYVITDTYAIENFFQRAGGRWKAEVFNMAMRDYLDYPKMIKRKSPFALGQGVHVRYAATLEFTKRNTMVGEETVLLADDHVQFASRLHSAGMRSTLRQELDFLADHVKPAEVAAYVEKQGQIRRRLGLTMGFPDRSALVWSDNAARQALLKAANTGDAAGVERQLAAGVAVNATGYAGMTPLFVATLDNRLDVVRRLLSRGANSNPRTEDGWTPLLTAAQYGSEALVAEFLRAGVDVEQQRNGKTALMLAAENGHAGVLRQLLAHGAEVDKRNARHFNFTALMYASVKGQAEAVQALLESKADLALKDEKNYTSFLLAAESGHWAAAERLIKAGADRHAVTDKHGIGAMTMLVRANSYDAVLAGIQSGLDVNNRLDNGFTPLMFALQNGNRRVAELLKQHGARYREVGQDGWTPLMSAIEHLDVMRAKQLIAEGADVRVTDNYGVSALTLSSAFGLAEVAEAVIKKGADVNVVDKGWQETPLMYAVENGNKKLVELLVNNGADPNRKDVDGDSVLGRTWPVEKGELYDVLVAAGAKREFVHPANRASRK